MNWSRLGDVILGKWNLAISPEKLLQQVSEAKNTCNFTNTKPFFFCRGVASTKIPESIGKLTIHFCTLWEQVQMRCWHCCKIISKLIFKCFQAHFCLSFNLPQSQLQLWKSRWQSCLIAICKLYPVPQEFWMEILRNHDFNIISTYNSRETPENLHMLPRWSTKTPQISPNSYQ